MMLRLLPLLLGITFLSNATGFSVRPTIPIHSSWQRLTKLAAEASVRDKGKVIAEREGQEKKPVADLKGIDRTWSDGDFTPGGEIDLDVFYPENSDKPAGAVFFMHGFSQYPVAYEETLRDTATASNVVIFAVETGVLSKVSRGPLFSDRQFWLQRAVSYDTLQLIRMMQDGAFKDIVDPSVPVGLCGHSMGGGLCFYVASQIPSIDYVFAMAPAKGVEAFDPIAALANRTADHSLLLAGGWDLLVRPKAVESIAVAANKESSSSSVYGLLNRGVHTGFQDEIVIITVPITFLLSLIINFNVVFEWILFKVLGLVRTGTGQLEISNDLMASFFKQMVAGTDVTVETVEEAVPEKYEEKITLSNPQ